MPRKTTYHYNRRNFIAASALSTFGFMYAPKSIWGANDRIRVAGIGIGGKGSSDIDQAGNIGEVVALCDIDDNHLASKAKKFPNANKFNDFRVMFDRMADQIDAVTVSTPDNTHAVASLMAMKHGKHVYCQKPLTHDVWEAREMKRVAREMKVATQMGNQGTALDGLRRGVEIVRDGAIGPVREVHAWTNRPVWPQAPSIIDRPKGSQPVPSHIHWEQFLGPAPWRPFYHQPAGKKGGRGIYHPFTWRGWWDFGTGALGDMACHTVNMAFMALKLGAPTSVEASSGRLNPETYPRWATFTYEFPARGDMPPCKLVWYEGKTVYGKKNLPPFDLFHGEKPVGSGSIMVGDKGVLYSPNDYGAAFKLFPEKKFKDYGGPSPWFPRNGERNNDQGMKNEWAQAMRTGDVAKAYSNFDYAATFTETMLLGNVALKAGKKLEWDAKSGRAKNAPEADQWIKREYRKGWEV